MSDFRGFTSQETFVPVPVSFFQQVMPSLQQPAALKTALYALWRLQMQENDQPVLGEAALTGPEAQEICRLSQAELRQGLQTAVEIGLLLHLTWQGESFYLLNSPRGRWLQTAFQNGQWRPLPQDDLPPQPRPNIYRLYEEHIGPLSPLIVDALRDAETTYSADWVAEALEIAVKHNARNWRYVEAILKRWKEEGHVSQSDRRNAQETANRYRKGKYADFIE